MSEKTEKTKKTGPETTDKTVEIEKAAESQGSNIEENYHSTAVTAEMTREEFMKAEHLVQTGASDTLPGGRSVKDASNSLFELQKQQEKERLERGRKWADKANTGIKTGEAFLNEKVEVSSFDNGAVSARPVPEPVIDANAPLSDIPENYPGRKFLIARKVYSLEAVSKMDRDALIGIDGIGEATADLILAYGKTE